MREARILRIVVASPSDVQAERELLPGIIDEMNRVIATELGAGQIGLGSYFDCASYLSLVLQKCYLHR